MKDEVETYQGTMSKEETLDQLSEHARLDQIVQGRYWKHDEDGGGGPYGLLRGCAVGCLTHDRDGGHHKFPELFGLPVWFALLIDWIFEGLTVEEARLWPMRVMSAVPEGVTVDNSVKDRLAVRRLRELVLPLQDYWPEEVRDLVVEAIDGVVLALETGEGRDEARLSAREAGLIVVEAARAAESAEAAAAARSTRWATESARSAATGVETAAARSAAWAAESGRSAVTAGWAAEADLVIEILEGIKA